MQQSEVGQFAQALAGSKSCQVCNRILFLKSSSYQFVNSELHEVSTKFTGHRFPLGNL